SKHGATFFRATRVIAYRLHATFSPAIALSTMATDEAMEDVQPATKRPSVEIEPLKRKKFKAEDLPLSAAQHAAIDKLLHSFKKKGGFDSIRKQIWADFNDGDSKTNFTNELIALAESEIEREPAHLSRERGKAATLIEGAVDRGDVYKNVEQSIDLLASRHLDSILESVRSIRREDIGEEAAAEEEKTGSKTDEDYEAYVKAKRDAREEVYREEMRKQKEIEDEQKRIKAEEVRKKREIERQKEEEERARRKEIDDKRRAERERAREEQRALDDQRERERDERYERRRREDRERFWDRDRSRTRDRDRDRLRDRSPAYRSDRGLSPRSRDPKREKSTTSKDPTPAPAPPVDDKSLEEAALQMLLKEGEELAAKARQRPEFDFEEAEAIENGLKPSSTSGVTKADVKLGLPSGTGAGAEAVIDHLDLVLTQTIDERGLVMHLSDPETAKWMIGVAFVILEMKEVIDQLAGAVAGLLFEECETETGIVTTIEARIETERESGIDHDPDPVIETLKDAAMIVAAIEVETEIEVVTATGLAEVESLGHHLAAAPAAGDRDLDLALAIAAGIALAPALVRVLDRLLLDGDHALNPLHAKDHVLDIARASGALHLVL
ncbi:hypothetical protein N7462_005508, partial [Penicillium macrosclerotiorum]|uniref:uncharacterized protein n=1 Tax=Penicillium macrosclerotiorum TaxID=303699 RepID=UPI0025473F11